MSETPSKEPAILLVEDDEEIREGIIHFLKIMGYRVAWATNEEDSIREITSSPLKIGLILMDQRLSSDQSLSMGRRLRAHLQDGENIPVVVIPFEFTKEMEGRDENVGSKDYKTYLANSQQLEKLLNRLLPPK
jgi:DNA-binding response OmpR family regulator